MFRKIGISIVLLIDLYISHVYRIQIVLRGTNCVERDLPDDFFNILTQLNSGSTGNTVKEAERQAQ